MKQTYPDANPGSHPDSETHPDSDSDSAEGPDAIPLIDVLADGAILIDGGNIILHANPAGEVLLNQGLAKLRGHGLESFVEARHKLFAMVEKSRKEAIFLRCHDMYVPFQNLSLNKTYPFEGRIDILLPGTEAGARLLIFQKISPGDFLPAPSRTTEFMARFPQALLHEIRNPLSAIHGAAQLLEARLEEKERELAELIKKESNRIARLVDSVDYCPSGYEPEEINIHDIIDHALDTLWAQKTEQTSLASLEIQRQYDPSLPSLQGNKDSLIQLFLNIIKNAMEALPEAGGKITIMTNYQRGFEKKPLSGERVNYIEARIIDEGRGIEREMARNFFEPMVSHKKAGSGMGLAIASKIIDDYKGIIELLPRNPGAECRVLLPLKLAPLQRVAGKAQ